MRLDEAWNRPTGSSLTNYTNGRNTSACEHVLL